MKEWLKKVNKKEMQEILKNISPSEKYTVPDDLNNKIIENIKKISEENKSKKISINFFSPKLILSYSVILLFIITSVFLFNNQKLNIKNSFKYLFIEKPSILSFTGNVYLKKEKESNWEKIKIGQKIDREYILKTGENSGAVIRYSESIFLFVRESSSINFPKHNKKFNISDNSIELLSGNILINESNYNKESEFKLAVKDIIFIPRGTKFIVLYDQKKNISRLFVKEGIVGVRKKNIYNDRIENIKKKSKDIAVSLKNFSAYEYLIDKNKELMIKYDDFNNMKIGIDDIINEIESSINIDNNISKKINDDIKNLNILEKDNIEKNIKENDNIEWDETSLKSNLNSEMSIENKNMEKPIENKNIKKPVEKQNNNMMEFPKIYNNDFENNSDSFSKNIEWSVIKDNDGNHVISPVFADINSDLMLPVKIINDFSLQFKFKRFPNKDNGCWMAIDLVIDDKYRNMKSNDWILVADNRLILGNRSGDEYASYNFNFEFNKWYVLKIIVNNGQDINIYLDGNSAIIFSKKDRMQYQSIKFEGNPETGKWFLDNVFFESK